MFYLETVPTVESTQKEFQVSSFHQGRGKNKTYTIIPVDQKYTFFVCWLNQKAKFSTQLCPRGQGFASESELNSFDDE